MRIQVVIVLLLVSAILLQSPLKPILSIVSHLSRAYVLCPNSDPDKANILIVQTSRDILYEGFSAYFSGRIDKERPTLYVLRHASPFDFLVCASIHEKCRCVLKTKVLRHPIISKLLLQGDHIIVDVKEQQSRDNCKKKMQMLFRRGYSVVIFPEGDLNTKSATPSKIHPGGISMAIHMNIPIVVVQILNLPRSICRVINKQLIIKFLPAVTYSCFEEAEADIRQKFSCIMT